MRPCPEPAAATGSRDWYAPSINRSNSKRTHGWVSHRGRDGSAHSLHTPPPASPTFARTGTFQTACPELRVTSGLRRATWLRAPLAAAMRGGRSVNTVVAGVVAVVTVVVSVVTVDNVVAVFTITGRRDDCPVEPLFAHVGTLTARRWLG